MPGARRSPLALASILVCAPLIAAPGLARAAGGEIGPPKPQVGSPDGQIGPPQPQVGQPPPPPPAPPPAPAAPASLLKSLSYTLNGYVEAAYTYSFEKPSNGVIDYRGFDNRHNTFSLENAVIDASASLAGVSARIALQVGHTPSTYYNAGSEPNLPATPGVGPSTPDYWRFIQQAYAGYTTSRVAHGLTLEAGIFLSPIGPEALAAKDSWNYSRSNLFFGLPFYHTGARATIQATERAAFSLWIVNGWNSVVDNNAGKSVISSFAYKIPDRLQLQLLYMGGPERNSGAPEGQPWRHLADAYVEVDATSALSFMVQGDTGLERTQLGTSYWGAGAIYARVHPVSWLYLAARGDYLHEHRGSDAAGTASPIFFPASWVSSGTFTIEGKPHDNVSVRLEYRHDQAASAMYFAGDVKGDGVTTPFVANSVSQNTLTAAAMAWF